ncbi:unnamed protein product [Blepharisma stoltei]|uniref:Uncharacterized protein n=1 Tax=Blepharisma stoltei TaxID=1481888 RepID=A0AAU9IAQ1_9CILI|nr:unnamed protein product [Blepharisma stoltei]
MGSSSLVQFLKKLRIIHSKTSKKHKELIRILDSIDMCQLPDYPNKIAVSSNSLSKFAETANDLYENETETSEILDAFEEKILEIGKIKRVAKGLKQHLDHMKERIKRDNKTISNIGKRISSILKEYRERCHGSYVEFLKSVDLDLRRILKPLVPNKVIDENVHFPMMNPNLSLIASFESSKVSKAKDEDIGDELAEDTETESEDKDKTIEKLHEHVSMLINTLESVAKELINILADTNSKYYEIVNPNILSLNPKTPLAKPLPEYFTFDMEEPEDAPKIMQVQKDALNRLKSRLNELINSCDLSKEQAKVFEEKLNKMDKEGKTDIHEIFKDSDVPISKREEIVFKLIDSGREASKDVDINDMLSVCSVKNLHRKESINKFSKLKLPPSNEKVTKRKNTELDPRRALTPTPAENGFHTPQIESEKKERFFLQRASNPAEIKDSDLLSNDRSVPKIQKNKEIRVRSTTPTFTKKKQQFKTGISLSRKKIANKS